MLVAGTMGRLRDGDRVGAWKGVFESFLQAVLHRFPALVALFLVLAFAVVGHGACSCGRVAV